MAKTRHIQQRMSQRGISGEMLDLVAQFGSWQGDKCILNRKGCRNALGALDSLRKRLVRMEEKGGLVLVHEGGVDITAYRVDSYTRGRQS